MKKTLAMKLLEQHNIPYDTISYPPEERDAEVLAVLYFEVPPEMVFKTLVVPYKKNLLVMMPANTQLNLKKLAKVVGTKKLKMATHKEAEAITGLQVGGISPLALLNQGFQLYAHRSIAENDADFISAGQKGTNIKVPVDALLKLTGAKLADLA